MAKATISAATKASRSDESPVPSRTCFTTIPPIISLLIAVATLSITTYYYFTMITLTKNLQRATTFNSIHTEYSSQETLQAMEMLEEFIEEHGRANYASAFLELKKTKSPRGRFVDSARRRLVQWYNRLHYFTQFGFLTIDTLRYFPGVERAAHFIHLVEPLEFVSRTSTGREQTNVFVWLRTVFDLDMANMKYAAHHLDDPFVRFTLTPRHFHSTIPGTPEYQGPSEWEGQSIPSGCSCLCSSTARERAERFREDRESDDRTHHRQGGYAPPKLPSSANSSREEL